MRLSMVSEVPILQRRMPDTPVAAWGEKASSRPNMCSVIGNLLLLKNSQLNDTRSNRDNRKFGRG